MYESVPISTSTVGASRVSEASEQGPLLAVRGRLRTAAKLPFLANRPEQWRKEFLREMQGAQAAFEQHVTAAEGKAGEPACDAGMGTAVRELIGDHRMLGERLRRLALAAAAAEVVDLWLMIDLGERAVLLEMDFARHYHRLVKAVQEGALVETGEA